MKLFPAIIIFVSLFFACNKTSNNTLQEHVIVKLGNNTLTESELKKVLPKEITSKDSIIIAENIIENWIKDALMYDLAKVNINNMTEIDQLVENYKKSLIIYQYQEQLIAEKMSGETTEQEMKKYYDGNKDKFKLGNTIIRGLFLKIPVDAPQINKIKEWYKSPSTKDLENIEKYSIQNAVNYDYFYNRWVNWDDIMQCFPTLYQFPETLLSRQKQFEVQDSTFCYLLNVEDIIFSGDIEPYEYAKRNIKDMIINEKRQDFLKKFEDDLYQKAVNKGLIKRTGK